MHGLDQQRPGPALSRQVLDLLTARNMGYISTVNSDGSPHVVPVWVDEAAGDVLINTAAGRIWVRNAERDSRVSCLVHNGADPREYALIQGTVNAMSDHGAVEHFTALAHRYLGLDEVSPFAGEHRLIVRITPTRIIHKSPRVSTS